MRAHTHAHARAHAHTAATAAAAAAQSPLDLSSSCPAYIIVSFFCSAIEVKGHDAAPPFYQEK
eukprot:14461956-Heterocapsa_arctica.AAC.1